MRALLLAFALLLAAPLAADAVPTTCGGWPRAPIDMAEGYCAGIVLAPPPGKGMSVRTVRMPRMLLPRQDGSWIVVDMGGWDPGKGKVWRMTAKPGSAPVLKPLLSGLIMPHGLGLGPDGKVYVGEMSRIIRFDPDAPDPAATVEVVISGLPDNRLHLNRHPLSHFIFDANGDLLVNVGAPTDQCLARGKPDGSPRCAQSEGADPLAGVRRYRYLGEGRWDPALTMYARGLRNSLALVRTPAGTILQAENSYDFAPAQDTPYEELNVLTEGAHYGWPYCYDMDRTTAAWGVNPDFRCASARHTPPALLMPPHAAPLGMIVYDGAMFPALKGKVLISLHGYRPGGGRIVAYDLDAAGRPVAKAGAKWPGYAPDGSIMWKPYPGPAAEPFILTPGWGAIPGRRAMGAPVGLAVAADGAIWVADDRNGQILRIAKE